MPVGVTPIVHSQVIATVGEFGDFDDTTGADLTIATTDYYPAGQLFPQKIQGTHSYSDMTVQRAYDPQRDTSVIDWVERYKNGIDGPRVAIWRVVSPQGITTQTYAYVCKPVSYKKPDGKSGDNTIGQLTVTLAIEAQN